MKRLLTIIFLICCVKSFGQTKVRFDKSKQFTIINSKREITTQSSAPDTFACKGWTISQKNISSIIKNCRLVNGTEWDLTFEVLPCIVTGKLKQGAKTYRFEINAGSWAYIRNSDTTIILGDFKKSDRKYFLTPPDN